MMDMIGRAAKAMGDEQCRRAGLPPQDIEPTERFKAIARAALLAALDPEDAETVERVAHIKYLRRRDGTDDWNDATANTVDREFWRNEARADLRALSSMAQGEPSS